ncbi:MAG: hypothetical protein R2856_01470 [Caldilineaceae bacterium]
MPWCSSQIIEITDTDPIRTSGRVNFGGIVKRDPAWPTCRRLWWATTWLFM